MNPLMSGDSPKRFKEEDENDLKTAKKEKINFKDKKQEKEPIDEVKSNVDYIEDDKNEIDNIKDNKNKVDNIQVEKIDSKLVTNKSEIYNVQDEKIDNIQDDKNDVDFNFKTANTKTSNQQSKSIQIHKEDSQQPKEDPNKTINTTKPTVNIFQFDKPKTNQAKPSPFLLEKNEVKEENKEPFVVLKEDTEEFDHIFKEKCCFYKFFKKWEKIGYGTVYITREKENKRLIFFREGTMSKLIDLLLNFDCKPYKKEKGVGFINFKEVDGKIIKENVLLSFDSKLLIDDFYEIIRN